MAVKRKALPDGDDSAGKRGAGSEECPVASASVQRPPRAVRRDYGAQPPNFAALASRDSGLAPFVRVVDGRGRVDWTDPAALLAVTRALLREDFGLSFALPLHHLCPPVPQRLSYVHWVADLLDEEEGAPAEDAEAQQPHAAARVVLDVGCGASAIFPLLGYAAFGWRFVGTGTHTVAAAAAHSSAAPLPLIASLCAMSDCDASALACAAENVRANALSGSVELRLSPSPLNVLCDVVGARESFDAVMCNPPFHARGAAEPRAANPRRASAATESERSCEGGERAFIGRLYDDSHAWRTRIGWFTVSQTERAPSRRCCHSLTPPLPSSLTHLPVRCPSVL